jgi:uncharacterized protein
MSRQDQTIQASPEPTSAFAVLADPLEFAREGRSLAGSIEVVALARLQDLLTDTAGAIAWSVRGGVEDDGAGARKLLWLEIEGKLQLVCQRCLGPYDFPLQLSSCLELMAPGQPLPDEELEDDRCDAIEVDRNLDLLSLVEDEILLALPQSPRHKVCSPLGEKAGRSEKVSPFAALAALKK